MAGRQSPNVRRGNDRLHNVTIFRKISYNSQKANKTVPTDQQGHLSYINMMVFFCCCFHPILFIYNEMLCPYFLYHLNMYV